MLFRCLAPTNFMMDLTLSTWPNLEILSKNYTFRACAFTLTSGTDWIACLSWFRTKVKLYGLTRSQSSCSATAPPRDSSNGAWCEEFVRGRPSWYLLRLSSRTVTCFCLTSKKCFWKKLRGAGAQVESQQICSSKPSKTLCRNFLASQSCEFRSKSNSQNN